MAPLTGHVLQHVRLVKDDVVKVELPEEDSVVGGGDDHVIGRQNHVVLDLLVNKLETHVTSLILKWSQNQ